MLVPEFCTYKVRIAITIDKMERFGRETKEIQKGNRRIKVRTEIDQRELVEDDSFRENLKKKIEVFRERNCREKGEHGWWDFLLFYQAYKLELQPVLLFILLPCQLALKLTTFTTI